MQRGECKHLKWKSFRTPVHFLHRAQNRRIYEPATGRSRRNARTLVVNGKTRQTAGLTAWHSSVSNRSARHSGGKRRRTARRNWLYNSSLRALLRTVEDRSGWYRLPMEMAPHTTIQVNTWSELKRSNLRSNKYKTMSYIRDLLQAMSEVMMESYTQKTITHAHNIICSRYIVTV